MSVIGIDFGSDACVIGHVTGIDDPNKKLGVDIVLNDTSKRRTSSLVSFQGLQRFVGEHAEPYIQSNAKNTVSDLKKLLGHKFSDPEIQKEICKLPFVLHQLSNDKIGIEVEYCGKKELFVPEQIMAIILKHCCDLVKKDQHDTNEPELVISVPAFWNEFQRQALIDSCTISGLHLKSLINENASVCIDYGMFRNLKGEFNVDTPKYILFVDMGYSVTTAYVVRFVKSCASVLSCICDNQLGSSSFDRIIADTVAEEFKRKYHIDPRENVKSNKKLMIAATKAKLFLSPQGIDRATINIECLYQDYDFNGIYYLKDFQQKCKEEGLLARFTKLVQSCLNESGICTPDINSVEIVGGGMRVPQLKQTLATILKRDVREQNYGLSTTLNMDECICKGTTWSSALYNSTVVKMKPFIIQDRLYYDYSINDKVIFHRGEYFPITKTFSIPINRQGEYIICSNASSDPIYAITIVDDLSSYTENSVSFDVSIDSSCCIVVNSISINNNNTSKKLKYILRGPKNDANTLKQYIRRECEMSAQDEEIIAINKIKNDTESYMYKMKSNIESMEAMYITNQERESINYFFMDIEDWLYSTECQMATLKDVQEKYDTLKKKCESLYQRKSEGANRNSKIMELNNLCASLKRNVQDIQEHYYDVDPKDVDTIISGLDSTVKWLEDKVHQQSTIPLNKTPTLLSSDIDKKIEEVHVLTDPFLKKERKVKGSPRLSETNNGQNNKVILTKSDSDSDSDSDRTSELSDLSDF